MFRKRIKTATPPAQLKIPIWLSQRIHRAKLKFASSLSNYEKGLSKKQKKMAILLFSFSMILFFTYPIITLYFFNAKITPSSFKHQSITLPVDPRLSDSLDLQYLKNLKLSDSLNKKDSLTH